MIWILIKLNSVSRTADHELDSQRVDCTATSERNQQIDMSAQTERPHLTVAPESMLPTFHHNVFWLSMSEYCHMHDIMHLKHYVMHVVHSLMP